MSSKPSCTVRVVISGDKEVAKRLTEKQAISMLPKLEEFVLPNIPKGFDLGVSLVVLDADGQQVAERKIN